SEDGTTLSVSFGPRDGAWRRTIVQRVTNGPGARRALPLPDAPMLASKLVSLTLDKCTLNAFLQTPVALAALRELFLDVLSEEKYCWPSRESALGSFDEALSARVRCPALARFVVFAIPSEHAVSVVPTKLTRLGRALGLRDGRPAKPTLALAGCTFNGPPIRSALDELFSAVEIAECSGDFVPEYYRMCRYSGYFGEHDLELLDA
ncbi:hypothetical protein AURDEDRAFT_131957, partial [Auricularia subglabra TFB-10046 SS5]